MHAPRIEGATRCQGTWLSSAESGLRLGRARVCQGEAAAAHPVPLRRVVLPIRNAEPDEIRAVPIVVLFDYDLNTASGTHVTSSLPGMNCWRVRDCACCPRAPCPRARRRDAEDPSLAGPECRPHDDSAGWGFAWSRPRSSRCAPPIDGSRPGITKEVPDEPRSCGLGYDHAVTAAFDGHDLDGILTHFVPDATFDSPRGPDPWGRRFEGAEAVRAPFDARFRGIPDVRHRDDRHFVSADRGASEWTLTGTTTDGERLQVRGCDLWTFRDGLIVRKDSFWKIRPG